VNIPGEHVAAVGRTGAAAAGRVACEVRQFLGDAFKRALRRRPVSMSARPWRDALAGVNKTRRGAVAVDAAAAWHCEERAPSAQWPRTMVSLTVCCRTR
jgi:hypothetical protein